jgi:hypothetical protein
LIRKSSVEKVTGLCGRGGSIEAVSSDKIEITLSRRQDNGARASKKCRSIDMKEERRKMKNINRHW